MVLNSNSQLQREKFELFDFKEKIEINFSEQILEHRWMKSYFSLQLRTNSVTKQLSLLKLLEIFLTVIYYGKERMCVEGFKC